MVEEPGGSADELEYWPIPAYFWPIPAYFWPMSEPTPLPGIDESVAEEVLMGWLAELGYETRHGGDIAPGMPGAERSDYREVVLVERLREAIDRLNPDVPAVAREEALRQILRAESPALLVNNRSFHRMLIDPPEIEVARAEGGVQGVPVGLIDFEHPENNDWLAVNQFTVREHSHHLPDVVIFVNGLGVAGKASRVAIGR
ncbi:MAG: hypothetical protein DCC49_09040 [Acidobacteria bacterium]|nr:MAG: hypothetical protein DCC49_09040 [Acidobacteriota bacterium]